MQRHPRLQQIMSVLLRLWDAFELPPNPLDHLTELLGGPNQVQRPQLTGLASCTSPVDVHRPHIKLILMHTAPTHGPIQEAWNSIPLCWA